MANFTPLTFKTVDEIPMHKKGERLGSLLDRLIEASSMSRTEAVSQMSTAAGISESTVNQIIAGSIICPPIARLQGLARALPTSTAALRAAARNDGCMYEDE